MYQVTIKGRSLKELKKAVSDINSELSTKDIVMGMEKDLAVKEITDSEVLDVLESKGINVPVIAPTPVQTVSGDTDINGTPWDERIHSASKAKVKAGTWKNRKNIDANFRAQVEAQIKTNVQSAPVVAPAIPTPAPTPVHVVVDTGPVLPSTTPTPVVAPIAIPAPVPAIPTNGGHTLETFSKNIVEILARLMNDGTLTREYSDTLKAYFKTEELYDVNDEQKAVMFESFAESGYITKVM